MSATNGTSLSLGESVNAPRRAGEPCPTIAPVICADGTWGSMVTDASGNCLSTCPEDLANRILPALENDPTVVRTTGLINPPSLSPSTPILAALGFSDPAEYYAVTDRAAQSARGAIGGGAMLGLLALGAMYWFGIKRKT